jgi:hypothetical protein
MHAQVQDLALCPPLMRRYRPWPQLPSPPPPLQDPKDPETAAKGDTPLPAAPKATPPDPLDPDSKQTLDNKSLGLLSPIPGIAVGPLAGGGGRLKGGEEVEEWVLPPRHLELDLQRASGDGGGGSCSELIRPDFTGWWVPGRTEVSTVPCGRSATNHTEEAVKKKCAHVLCHRSYQACCLCKEAVNVHIFDAVGHTKEAVCVHMLHVACQRTYQRINACAHISCQRTYT